MQSRLKFLRHPLRLPLVAAPMFLVSGPDLVIAACKAGIIGSFPTLNARPIAVLDEWMTRITAELAAAEAARPGSTGPWAANLIVHRTNTRFEPDLELVVKHRPSIVISALGSPQRVLEPVHAYGGVVFADVNSVEFARKAADAGADGLVLVAAGAGGHTGQVTPFAMVPAVRAFFDGPIIVGGGIADGRGIRAVEVLGADLAYVGTRFIATSESLATDAYKRMLIEATAADIVPTAAFTGVTANYLAPSIRAAGIDPKLLATPNPDMNFDNPEKRGKAWKDIWSAGHAVSAIHSIVPVAELVTEFERGYRAALQE